MQGRLAVVVVSMNIGTRCDQRFHDTRVVDPPSGLMQGSPSSRVVVGAYV